ncbi:MAG: hypothetical protein P8X63_14230, partial [Desulfuromonadaceae bacterium]
MFSQMKLAPRFLLAFLLLGLTPFALVSYLTLQKSEIALSAQAFNQLQGVREIKKSQIEGFFSERFGDIVVLSRNDSVLAALKAFAQSYDDNGKRVGGEAWNQAEAQFGPWLNHYQKEYGYYDLFLISKAGEVVYSAAKESDLGADLQRGKLKDSSLAEAFRQGLLQPVLVDFKPYAPSNNEPASFIAAP